VLIKKISYKNKSDENKNWKYEGLEFKNINLVVGYNSTGKTRTLASLRILSDLLSRRIKIKKASEEFEVLLEDLEDTYNYKLEYEKGIIKNESLKINDKLKLKRMSNEEGWIYSEKLGSKLDFSISNNELAVIAKRDKIQHPFLEKLIQWGNNSIFYDFASKMGRNFVASFENIKVDGELNDINLNLKNTNAVVGHLKYAIEKYGKKMINKIVGQMKELGYFIEDINVDPLPNFPADELEIDDIPYSIWVKEKDLSGKTYQSEMSQGMFRALSLIIQTNLCAFEKRSDLFIIDDIGEGLDHNRSRILIKQLIDTAENSNIQLLMATNDRYVMNNIPLKYWQIIQRENGNCKFFNYLNSKEIFDEFEFTGLSNFDFLSTEFYLGEDII